jgi:hypothetical protein
MFSPFKYKRSATAFIQVWILECCVQRFAALAFVSGFGQLHDSPKAMHLHNAYFSSLTAFLASRAWGQGGIAPGLGAGERLEGSTGEVLAGFEHETFKFSDAAGVCGFLFEGLEDGLHVLVEIGHGLSLQVPICGCTPQLKWSFRESSSSVCCFVGPPISLSGRPQLFHMVCWTAIADLCPKLWRPTKKPEEVRARQRFYLGATSELGVLQGFHQLINNLSFVATQGSGSDMGLEMPAKHNLASTGKRTLHGLDLPQDIHAIHMRIVQHANDALEVSLGDGETARGAFAALLGHAQVARGHRTGLHFSFARGFGHFRQPRVERRSPLRSRRRSGRSC